MEMKEPTVFISYSHKDEDDMRLLVTHLGVIKQQGRIDLWVDTTIGTGQNWKQQIQEAMEGAYAAVLLVSADFLNSDFVLLEEMPTLLKRRRDEGMPVFPLILRPCLFQEVPWLNEMKIRPHDAKPLSGFSPHDKEHELCEFAKELLQIVRKRREDSGPRGGSEEEKEVMSEKRQPSRPIPFVGRYSVRVFGDDRGSGIIEVDPYGNVEGALRISTGQLPLHGQVSDNGEVHGSFLMYGSPLDLKGTAGEIQGKMSTSDTSKGIWRNIFGGKGGWEAKKV